MFINFFAHAAEFHTEDTTETEHVLTEWWFGLAAYGLVLYLIFGLARHTLSLATRLSLALGISIVVGLVFYRWTPLLSGVAIVLGFSGSLALALGVAKHDK